MDPLILSMNDIEKLYANLFTELRETASERQTMKKIITSLAVALLMWCMTPVDYGKPRPLKEGEAASLDFVGA